MSLFSSIQLAKNSLTATEIGLHVVGNNIANANTPGYIRQTVEYAAAPPQKLGTLPLGLGAEVVGIHQEIDKFLNERLRSATSDLNNAEQQEKTYLELEGLTGELNDTGFGTTLTNFFNSIQDVLNQPDSASVRNLAVLRGSAVTDDLNRLATVGQRMQVELNDRIGSMADDINGLTSEIARLNVQIVQTEGGASATSDAVGLRDNRATALKKLSELIDIRTFEQGSGAVTVMVGGDFLVADGTHRDVVAATDQAAGNNFTTIKLVDSDSELKASSGQLAGLKEARDQILGGYLQNLNDFSKTLAFEFNKAYSSGQGLVGHQDLTSEASIANRTVALDHAGLTFSPVNGSFDVLIRDTATGLTTTRTVNVRLNGLGDDTTYNDLVAQLNGIDGLDASITSTGQLHLQASQGNFEFAFAHDTSGTLAALGVSTFFTGSSAATIGVNAEVQGDPQLFAASQGGIGQDTDNALLLGDFLNQPLAGQGGKTLASVYDSVTSSVSQGSAAARSVAEGFRTFQGTLEGQSQAVSGVSIDEEAVKMLMLQRIFQASAKFISTISDLMETLVNL